VGQKLKLPCKYFMRLNFRSWLNEAVTEFPGNIRVPPKLLSDVTKYYLDIFLKVILQSTIENLQQKRVVLKNTQKLSQYDAPVDMDEIESTVSSELYGSGASKEDYDDLRNQHINLQKKRYKQDYKTAAKDYNELLDLQKYLKSELGVKRDYNLEETLNQAEYGGKKFQIDLKDFSDIMKKLEKSGNIINKDYLTDHFWCILSSGQRAKDLNYGGMYHPITNVLEIPLSGALNINSIENLFIFINKIKSNIAHELIHVFQSNVYDVLKIYKDNDPASPDFSSRLNPEDKLKFYYASKVEHPAQLISAVADFKKQLENNARYDKNFVLTNDMIRFYTDQINELPNSEHVFTKHPLFVAMKKYQPEYYRKTIINFIKLLNKEPINLKRKSFGSSAFTPTVDIKSLIRKD
jgi:hypothetical protein